MNYFELLNNIPLFDGTTLACAIGIMVLGVLAVVCLFGGITDVGADGPAPLVAFGLFTFLAFLCTIGFIPVAVRDQVSIFGHIQLMCTVMTPLSVVGAAFFVYRSKKAQCSSDVKEAKIVSGIFAIQAAVGLLVILAGVWCSSRLAVGYVAAFIAAVGLHILLNRHETAETDQGK